MTNHPQEIHSQTTPAAHAGLTGLHAIFVLGLVCSLASSAVVAQQVSEKRPIGPGHTVNSKFGGQIFGFDIDQNGVEGVLSEALDLNNGNVLAATETFNQKTGKIIKVVAKTETEDNFITWGVFGASIGMVERDHVKGGFVQRRTFPVLNPLNANKFTGTWTPPLRKDDIILGVSRIQGTPNIGVLAFENNANFETFVFGSDIAANTFGPHITLKDPNFAFNNFPVIAMDSKRNQAVVATQGGDPFGPPTIGLVDLVTGKVTEFTGLGQGVVNGLAVDPATHIACTTTEIDGNIQFYNLTKRTGINKPLPGQSGQFTAGTDVEFDPIHKLFLVAQPNSSTQNGSSAIYVYDEKGNVKETLNGFHFSNTFNVIPAHISLNPAGRSGYVDGPAQNVTDIQSFTY